MSSITRLPAICLPVILACGLTACYSAGATNPGAAPAAAPAVVPAAPFQELTPKFDRVKSRTMIRRVAKPTVADLDYAAYIANPVRFDPKMPKPKAPEKKMGLTDLTFDDMLSQVCVSFAQTPLTDAEKASPLAWKALVERLWKVVKEPGFAELGSRIESKKWADPNVVKPYQEVTTAYLHTVGDQTHVWVKVEFAPFVKFLEGITDEDKDGFPEIYGELSVSKIDAGIRTKAYEWIRGDYCTRLLTRQEVTDWITTLASYWYPTYNTDIVDMSGETVWPNKNTDKSIVGPLKGLVVRNPTAVVRANPFGKVIFNVYAVEGLEAEQKQEAVPAAAAPVNKTVDAGVSKNFADNATRLKDELKPYGSYPVWATKQAAIFDAEKAFLAKLPQGQMGFKGKDDFVFFRKSLEYCVGGDLGVQPKDKLPLPYLVEFKKYLGDHNVNLLFVPVPNKEEVYYEKLPFETARDATAIINPYSRKFLKDAQDAGIEVIDLLPLFLKAKGEDKYFKEEVYQRQDTHWTNRGLQIAAKAIADRVREYGWYKDVAKDSVHYTVKDTTFSRLGDIVDKLPEGDRAAYPAVELQGQQVITPDGKHYEGNRGAPIMLVGDSFTGVFEAIDCKSAGVGSHIAQKTGIPVDIITSWGGGPLVRDKMVRARKNDLGVKRLVVYVMVARDLYNYAQLWTPLKTD